MSRARLLLRQALGLVPPVAFLLLATIIFELGGNARTAVVLAMVVFLAAGMASGMVGKRIGHGPVPLLLQLVLPALACALVAWALRVPPLGWVPVALAAPLFLIGAKMSEEHALLSRIQALRPWLSRIPHDVLRRAINTSHFNSRTEAARFLANEEPALSLDDAMLLVTRARWDGSSFRL